MDVVYCLMDVIVVLVNENSLATIAEFEGGRKGGILTKIS
jgi:hypothetical protein